MSLRPRPRKSMVTTWRPASANTGTNRSNERQLADRPCTHRTRRPSGSPFDSTCRAPDVSWIRLVEAISSTRSSRRLMGRGRECVVENHDTHPVEPLVEEDAFDPPSLQSALQIERAAHPDHSVMGREPGVGGPPPGIAKLHEEIP